MVLLLAVYIIALLNQPEPTNWSITLSKNDKIPFGSYIVYDQLNSMYPQAAVNTYRESVYNVLNEKEYSNTAYFIVSPGVALGKAGLKRLLQFAENICLFIFTKYSLVTIL